MVQEKRGTQTVGEINRRQQIYGRFIVGVLIDLTVLNLFDEYWDHVAVTSFTVSLLVALLLQVLLKITIQIEHRVGAYFAAKPGKFWTAMRLFSAWLILFGSKFVILGAVNFAFGDEMHFGGPLHGIVAFIVVVVAMLVAEVAVLRLNKALGLTKEAALASTGAA